MIIQERSYLVLISLVLMSKEHELCDDHDYYNIISEFAEIKARKITLSNKN